MNKFSLSITIATLLLLFYSGEEVQAQIWAQLETGVAISGYNNVIMSRMENLTQKS